MNAMRHVDKPKSAKDLVTLTPRDHFKTAADCHLRGNFQQAIEIYKIILADAPRSFEAHVNLGCALLSIEKWSEAEQSLRRAITLEPNCAEAHNNLGNVLEHLAKLSEAEESYRQALSLRPRYPDALFNLANICRKQDRLFEAEDYYRDVLAIDGKYADAYLNLANIQLFRGQPASAINLYENAIKLKPQLIRAYKNLAEALCQCGRIAEAFDAYMTYSTFPTKIGKTGSYKHEKRHNAEQKLYLAQLNRQSPDESHQIPIGARLAANPINLSNVAQTTAVWETSSPKIVVIDNFLTVEAIQSLQRFCWASNAWRRPNNDGYIGALPEDGFSTPLIAQIVDELPRAYPSIFRGYPFRRLAAFKYDSSMGGLKVHADNAAINVNFWVTPDEANLDPDSGGVVIWDVAAPTDWSTAQLNGDARGCEELILQRCGRPTSVPYRANRAVVFDSDLLHRTDDFSFKSGYLNRRISISLLFGAR